MLETDNHHTDKTENQCHFLNNTQLYKNEHFDRHMNVMTLTDLLFGAMVFPAKSDCSAGIQNQGKVKESYMQVSTCLQRNKKSYRFLC